MRYIVTGDNIWVFSLCCAPVFVVCLSATLGSDEVRRPHRFVYTASYRHILSRTKDAHRGDVENMYMYPKILGTVCATTIK
jgi:hypothetical protein